MTALFIFTTASVIVGGGIILASVVLSRNNRFEVLLRRIGRGGPSA